MRTVALALLPLVLVGLLTHCGSSSQCYDCGGSKPASRVLAGSEACPESVGLTRASLLDDLRGDHVGRAVALDGGTPQPDAATSGDGGAGASTATITVKVEATNGVVTCDPSYSAGFSGLVPATVHADAKLIIDTSDGALRGVALGTAKRTSLLPSQVGARLNDIELDTPDLDPATLSYVPRTAGAKVRLHVVLHAGGTLTAVVSELDGPRPQAVIAYGP